MSSATTGDSSNNGKRERSDDEDTDIGSSPKILKRSDSERETTTSESAAESSDSAGAAKIVESVPVINQEGGVKKESDTQKELAVAKTSVAVKEGEDVQKPETTEESTAAPVAATPAVPAANPAADPSYVLDRSGTNGAAMSAPPNPSPPSVPAPASVPPTTVVAAPPVDINEVVEEKGEINIQIAGRVIGKGGEIIRDLQARSGAQIDVDQSALPGRPRVITYRGPRSKVEYAKSLVQMIASGVPDSQLPLGEAHREILIIPASATGKVIGRGGEMVREMQNRSHAKIDFDHSAQVGPDQKRVIVTGTTQAVVKAKEMILFLVANPLMEAMQSLNMLVDDKLRNGGQWGSGPPYPNLPNQGQNMRPENDAGSGGASYGAGPPGYGAPPGGNMYGGGGGPNYYGGPPMGGSVGGRYQGGMSGNSVTEMMYAKKQFMGRIIGSKGVTINDLQKKSNTDIQINQDVPPGADCEITIKGSREGVESAKQMINTVIESGPNHPFAGGGYNAGGGGGYNQAGGYNAGGYAPSYGAPPAASTGGYGYGQQPQQPVYGGYQQPPQQQHMYGGQSQSQPAYNQQSHYQDPSQAYAAAAPQPAPAAMTSGYGGQYGASQPQYGGQPQQSMMPAQQQMVPQPQPPAQAAPPVVDTGGWKATTTADGQTYYWNERTGVTQWEKPPGMP